jgi:hypothetical protein
MLETLTRSSGLTYRCSRCLTKRHLFRVCRRFCKTSCKWEIFRNFKKEKATNLWVGLKLAILLAKEPMAPFI